MARQFWTGRPCYATLARGVDLVGVIELSHRDFSIHRPEYAPFHWFRSWCHIVITISCTRSTKDSNSSAPHLFRTLTATSSTPVPSRLCGRTRASPCPPHGPCKGLWHLPYACWDGMLKLRRGISHQWPSSQGSVIAKGAGAAADIAIVARKHLWR